jgi:hypothetical protein
VARKVEVTTICDITGEPGAVTVEFGLLGKHYTIDLAPGPLQDIQNSLAGFVESATEVKNPTKARTGAPRRGTGPAKPDREQNAAIREWANRNGFNVSPRGRLSAEVLAAFEEAFGPRNTTHQSAPVVQEEPVPVG